MRRKILSVMILLVFLVSCKQNKERTEDIVIFTEKSFNQTIRLKSEVWGHEGILNPGKIFDLDSLILLLDTNRPKSVFVFDKKNGKLINNVISRGLGPNEMIDCWELQIKKESIWAFDLQTGKLACFKP